MKNKRRSNKVFSVLEEVYISYTHPNTFDHLNPLWKMIT